MGQLIEPTNLVPTHQHGVEPGQDLMKLEWIWPDEMITRFYQPPNLGELALWTPVHSGPGTDYFDDWMFGQIKEVGATATLPMGWVRLRGDGEPPMSFDRDEARMVFRCSVSVPVLWMPEPAVPTDSELHPEEYSADSTEHWAFTAELFRQDGEHTDEWVEWTVSEHLEDVLDTLMDQRSGQYGEYYTAARITYSNPRRRD